MKFTNYNKFTALVEDVNNAKGCAWVYGRGYMRKLFVFAMNLKLF